MWITEYRERHGLTLEQLGAMIRRAGRRKEPELRVSDILLERLETEPNFRTVPRLADLIAEACGATARQRDKLVLEQYRGTWKPTRIMPEIERKRNQIPAPAPAPGPEQRPEAVVDRRPPANSRAVVKINRQGVELERYRSCGYAGDLCGFGEKLVAARCHRRYRFDEFNTFGYTFRFADEWDGMSPTDRQADIARNMGKKAPRGGTHGAQMVTAIGRHGQVRDYDSIKEAATACKVGYALLQRLLYMTWEHAFPVAEIDGMRFVFTDRWDAMDESARARVLEGR